MRGQDRHPGAGRDPGAPRSGARSRLNPPLQRAAVFWGTWLALVLCLLALRGIYHRLYELQFESTTA